MKLLSILLVIIGGMGLGTEAGILGPLGQQVGHYWATLSIFAIGTGVLLFLVIFFAPRSPRPLMSVPGWHLVGGLLGPCYVMIMTVATPAIGVAMTMTGILAGQIAKSLVIDHFGLFGSEKRPVNVRRAIALALVAGSLALIAGGS